ncbi:MAG: hypothetical protein WBO10_10710 [Pyrinomonadaceae bacterium]
MLRANEWHENLARLDEIESGTNPLRNRITKLEAEVERAKRDL